jgi:Membrane carboxypeptidase/penicillin-binding protein
MKRILRIIGKIALRLSAFLLLTAMVITVYYGVKGWQMYQKAIKDTPITKIGSSIRSKEHFTHYRELPEIYIDAVISAEDKRFFSHPGIDPVAIGRAVWKDITTLSFAEGGSTITQQIAKNELFTQEKKVERKFAEIFAAFALEKEYNKEEIFELYVNTIYFGSGYYGIHDAAEGYFKKSPSELTDYEAIMLAGIPNAPSNYSPDASMELARKRMSLVLEKMVHCNKITQKQADHILTQSP